MPFSKRIEDTIFDASHAPCMIRSRAPSLLSNPYLIAPPDSRLKQASPPQTPVSLTKKKHSPHNPQENFERFRPKKKPKKKPPLSAKHGSSCASLLPSCDCDDRCMGFLKKSQQGVRGGRGPASWVSTVCDRAWRILSDDAMAPYPCAFWDQVVSVGVAGRQAGRIRSESVGWACKFA